MTVLINLILAFYPATLLWNNLPNSLIKNIEGVTPSQAGHFLSLAILYLVIYLAVYFVLSRFINASYLGGGQIWSNTLVVISAIILFLYVFYLLLPGATVYPSPIWLSHYLLQAPYNLFAILVPLLALFIY